MGGKIYFGINRDVVAKKLTIFEIPVLTDVKQ